MHDAGSDLLQPERICDGIAVDKGDDVTLGLPDPEVSAGPAGPSKDVQVDEVVSLLVSPHDVAGRVLAVRIDDDHLEGRLLHQEAVQQRGNIPSFIADRHDDADEQRGS